MLSRNLTLKLILPALLAAAPAGCAPPRKLYYFFTHQMAMVPSGSMAPTIKPGDHVAIKVGFYDKRPLERFDIVAYKQMPENLRDVKGVDAETIMLGRVIGLGGESVELKGGRVFVNGRPLEEPFQTVPDEHPPPPDFDRAEVRVPEGECFLLGDNRPNSFDGRFWKRPTLKKSYVHGKVVEIFPQGDAAEPRPPQ